MSDKNKKQFSLTLLVRTLLGVLVVTSFVIFANSIMRYNALLEEQKELEELLNELNEDTDYALIETVEREAIALLIQDAVVARGMVQVPEDVTEEWRDW